MPEPVEVVGPPSLSDEEEELLLLLMTASIIFSQTVVLPEAVPPATPIMKGVLQFLTPPPLLPDDAQEESDPTESLFVGLSIAAKTNATQHR